MTYSYHLQLFGDIAVSDAPLVCMIENEHEAENVWKICRENGSRPFILAGVSGVNWEQDLSPWEAKAVFKGSPDFTGGADRFLANLQHQIRSADCSSGGRREIYLAGYSLAGLFAVYAAHHTDLFTGIVSASGSLWFPEFKIYMEKHQICAHLKKAYLSVGDKEAKTKNVLMKEVQDNTAYAAERLSAQGVQIRYELNPGGHFVNPDERLAKGICWVLQ